MTIRPASRGDLPAMAALLGELFSIEDDFTVDALRQSSALSLLLEHPDAVLLVALIGDEVAGMISMQRIVSTATGGYAGLIEDLVVSGRFRRRKIGSALLHAVKGEANKRSWTRLSLGADVRNAPALSFYRHHGFIGSHLHMMYFFPSA